MPIPAVFFKWLDASTPNLSLAENTTQKLLWDTAGRLSGLIVSTVTLSGGDLIITLTPGAFIHNGIVVQYPQGTTVTISPAPGTFSISDPLNLIAQSNGPDEAAAPNFSLISTSALNAQADAKNFAAVISVYFIQLPSNQLSASILESGDGTNQQWTATPLQGAGLNYRILNGSVAGGYLAGAAGNISAFTLQNLPSSSAAFVTAATLSISGASDFANTTRGVGSVTVAGANSTAGDNFSVFADGIETLYTTPAGPGETPANTAIGIANAINVNPDVSLVMTAVAVGPVVNITSVQYGRAGNFDLRAITTSISSTLTVSAAMGGGSQPSILVEFPDQDPGPPGILPITVYPPVVHSGVPTNHFSLIQIPLEMSAVAAPTFDNLLVRITAQSPSADNAYVNFVSLDVIFNEANGGIDPTPPTNVFHWQPGPNVSVGGGQGTSLGAHRTLIPIDHPNRSISRIKMMLGAIGPLELDTGVIGPSFSAHAHIPGDNLLSGYPPGNPPWSVVGDFNLKELSDLVKSIALSVGGPSGLGGGFARDHDVVTGHHRGAKYADLVAAPPNSGMIVLLTAGPGDSTLDPTGDTTHAQFFMSALSAPPAAAIYTRRAVLGSLGATEVFGVTSNSKALEFVGAANRETGLEISLETGKHAARWSRTEAGAADVYGHKSINGVPAAALHANRMTLFTGGLIFCRTDVGDGVTAWPAPARTDTLQVDGTQVYRDLDSSVVADSGAASYLPKPCGTPLYAEPSHDNDFHTIFTDSTASGHFNLTPVGSEIGNFPSPFNITAGWREKNLNVQWFYLPFTTLDVFRAVQVRAYMIYAGYSNETSHNSNGVNANYGNVFGGLMGAPAYDFAEAAGTLSTPVVPAYNAAPFHAKTSGAVRRLPWVLTPTGFNTPNGGDDGTFDNGCYFDPKNGGATYDPRGYFTRPAVDYSTTFRRLSSLNDTVVPGNSFVKKGPLPYYDKRSSGDVTANGVLMDLTQLQSTSFYESYVNLYWGGATQYAMCVDVLIPLKDSSGAFLTAPGSARRPDGIAITPYRADLGMNNVPTVTPAVASAKLFGYQASSDACELPVYVHFEIVGIADGLESKVIP